LIIETVNTWVLRTAQNDGFRNMNLVRICFLLAVALLFAGCESVTDRFGPVEPKRQVFNADQATVSAAALQAFKRLDFRASRSRKSGDIEAYSQIHTSAAFADSRQLTAKLTLNDAGPGRTEVEMRVTEQVQSQSMGGTSQQTMREHGFFQLYFSTLQQVLDEQAATAPAKKN
jgi:hypothetical protein